MYIHVCVRVCVCCDISQTFQNMEYKKGLFEHHRVTFDSLPLKQNCHFQGMTPFPFQCIGHCFILPHCPAVAPLPE